MRVLSPCLHPPAEPSQMPPLQGSKQTASCPLLRAFAMHFYAPAATVRRADAMTARVMGPEITRAKSKASMWLAVKRGSISAAKLISPHVALAWDV